MNFGRRKQKETRSNRSHITDVTLQGSQVFSKEEAKKLKLPKGCIPFLHLLTKNKELNRLITPEFMMLVSDWVWKEEENFNSQIGISTASAFFGKYLPNAAVIYDNAQNVAGTTQILDITKGSGFKELFQVSPGLPEEQYLLIEMMVAKRLVDKSLENVNKKPKDIDLFIIASSFPPDPYVEQKIAQAIGIKNKTPKFLYVKACDSSGSAILDVTSGKYDHLLKKKFKSNKTATVTVLSIEDWNRISNASVDPYSAQLFSSGASAVTFNYHPHSKKSSLRLRTGINRSIAEGSDVLKIKAVYKDWPQKDNTYFANHVVKPKTDKIIDMDQRKTGVVFKKHVREVVQELLQEHSDKTGLKQHIMPSMIKKVIMHHPSETIYNHVVRALAGTGKRSLRRKNKGMGFKHDQFEFVISEGNVPSAILPIALGRQMYDLNPDDFVMFLTYGAGGSFTAAIYRLGRNIH